MSAGQRDTYDKIMVDVSRPVRSSHAISVQCLLAWGLLATSSKLAI